MICSSSLHDDARALILDTSVLINLHACTYGERILTSISNDIIVAKVVARELEHETSRRQGEHSFLQDLIQTDKLSIADMIDTEYDLFDELVSGSPSLDDGEAETIAIAKTRDFLPVIDDGAGRTRAAALMSQQEPGWSLDLLRHPDVLRSLGEEDAANALYMALRDGRMRIPPDSVDGAIAIIGIERARECKSLPDYGNIFPRQE